MTDCVSAEIRDQLPDLLHERLDASARAAVLAHVDRCAECAAELAVLRQAHAMIVKSTPRVDVAYIVGALPKAPQSEVVRIAPRRRVWTDWRVAAAITLLVAGGSSVALLQRGGSPAQSVLDTLRTPVVAAPTPVASTSSNDSAKGANAIRVADSQKLAQVATPSSDEESPDLSPGSRLGGLNADQLKTLLDNIDKLQAVPVTEPDPVVIRVSAQSSTSGDDAP